MYYIILILIYLRVQVHYTIIERVQLPIHLFDLDKVLVVFELLLDNLGVDFGLHILDDFVGGVDEGLYLS